MSTYNLGRILSVYRGDYDNATTYKPLDLVYTDSGTYVAKQTVTGIAPTTDTNEYWQVVSKNITNEEIRELYEADEATRNARLTAFIGEASQTLEELEASLTASVNNAIAPIATTLTNITATVEAGEQERNNKVDNLVEETTNAFEQAESNRETTLTNAITTINNNDTVYKTQLQSSVNSWLNEKGVEFSEAQQERATEFNAQEASRAGRFSTQLNNQATAFNNQQTQQANTFTNSQNSRTTTFTASEQERANIFAQTEAQREADIEIIAQEAERLTNLEETKANRDDYCVEFTAGMAEQLLSPDGIIDSEPYLYRTSAGSTSISTGVAQVEKLEGNSIVFNQLNNMEDELIVTPVSYAYIRENFQSSESFVGHKVYYSFYGYGTYSWLIAGRQVGRYTDENYTFHNGIYTINNVYSVLCGFSATYGTELKEIGTKKVMLIDLTRMFGAGNEPTVEQFKQWFPKDYYPYNTGEIINVNIDGLRTIGFNQWDEEFVNGYYKTIIGEVAEIIPYNNTICNKTLIKVFPNTNYYIKTNYDTIVYMYDEEKTLLKYVAVTLNNKFTTTEETKYISFRSVCPTYNNDIAINIEWSGYRNGDYEPYVEHNINISVKEIVDGDNNILFPNGLLSAGSVKDEVTSDKAIKRCDKENLKNTDWHIYTLEGVRYFYARPSSEYRRFLDVHTTVNCINYPLSTESLPQNGSFSNNSSYMGEGFNFILRDDSITTVAELKNKILGDYTFAYVNTIEVEFKDVPQVFGEKLNLTYFVDDFGTEEFTTDITGLVAPVAHKTKYLDNLVDKIRTINGNTATACITNAGIDNLISTLGNAIGFTITKTWDTTNKCWTFTATPNNTDNNL